jgi:hypothetical protein
MGYTGKFTNLMGRARGNGGGSPLVKSTITVVSPTNDSVIQAFGNPVVISWVTTGVMTGAFLVEYSMDEGATWHEICTTLLLTYSWTLPDACVGKNVIIRVSLEESYTIQGITQFDCWGCLFINQFSTTVNQSTFLYRFDEEHVLGLGTTVNTPTLNTKLTEEHELGMGTTVLSTT